MTLRPELLIALTLLTFRNRPRRFVPQTNTHKNFKWRIYLQSQRVRGTGLKVQQIRLHINGSIYFQLKDAIDLGLLVCMGKQQMSEECS